MNSGLAGWGNGLAGVIIFSASLPATRVAVAEDDVWAIPPFSSAP